MSEGFRPNSRLALKRSQGTARRCGRKQPSRAPHLLRRHKRTITPNFHQFLVARRRRDMSSVETRSESNSDGEPNQWFHCSSCDYRTDRRNNMKRHLADMHMPTTEKLECCDKLFTTKGDLREHTRQIHKDGFKCPECGKVCNRKALLQRHSSVHTGIKEFRCDVCGYKTSSKSNLERHLKSDKKKPELAKAATRALAKLKASSRRRRSSLRGPEEPAPHKPIGAHRGFTIEEPLRPYDDSNRSLRAAPQGGGVLHGQPAAHGTASVKPFPAPGAAAEAVDLLVPKQQPVRPLPQYPQYLDKETLDASFCLLLLAGGGVLHGQPAAHGTASVQPFPAPGAAAEAVDLFVPKQQPVRPLPQYPQYLDKETRYGVAPLPAPLHHAHHDPYYHPSHLYAAYAHRLKLTAPYSSVSPPAYHPELYGSLPPQFPVSHHQDLDKYEDKVPHAAAAAAAQYWSTHAPPQHCPSEASGSVEAVSGYVPEGASGAHEAAGPPEEGYGHRFARESRADEKPKAEEHAEEEEQPKDAYMEQPIVDQNMQPYVYRNMPADGYEQQPYVNQYVPVDGYMERPVDQDMAVDGYVERPVDQAMAVDGYEQQPNVGQNVPVHEYEEYKGELVIDEEELDMGTEGFEEQYEEHVEEQREGEEHVEEQCVSEGSVKKKYYEPEQTSPLDLSTFGSVISSSYSLLSS